ncbi:MAG: MFS transporter [Halobacteriales archaeon]
MANDRWLYALALSSVASGIAGLLVPLYLVRIGAGAAALGITAALSSLVGAPGAILAGGYADRTGRRRGVVLFGLIVSVLAIGLIPLLESVTVVIVVNAVLWIALAAIGPIVTMLIVQDQPEERWADRIAQLNKYQGYGGTAGLVIGTIWTGTVALTIGPAMAQRSLFVLAALIGVASAFLAVRYLPPEARLSVGAGRSGRIATILFRTNRRVRDATFAFGGNRFFWAFRSLPRDRIKRLRENVPTVLWTYFIAAFLFFAGFAVFWAPLPLYLTDLGLLSGSIFALYLVNNIASTVLYSGAGRATSQYDVRYVQGGALGLRAGAFVMIGVFGVLGLGTIVDGQLGVLLVIGAILAVIGMTWAFIAVTGVSIVSRFAPQATRGGILGLYAALSAIAGSLGSLAGGWLATISFPLAFGVAAALVVCGGSLVLATKRLARAEEMSTTDSDVETASIPPDD